VGQNLKRKYDLAIIDYLGLIETKQRYENRTQQISYISRSFKTTARGEGLPLVALSQLNRGNEKEGRAPVLSDLRDSGTLEQDCDGAILLHQPSRDRGAQGIPVHTLQMIGAKQPNGPTFVQDLFLQKEFCRILEKDFRT
jgi:replicative DNA helicase